MTKKTIQDNFDAIQTTASRRIFDILAEEGNNKHTVEAFDFLFNVYSALFEKIKQNPESFLDIEFNLFDEVAPLLYQRMKELSFRESQGKLHLGSTISMALWIAVLSKKQDASHIRDFVWKISSDYLPYRIDKGEICNETYWAGLFFFWDFEFSKTPECRQKFYAGQSNGLLFDYFYGLFITDKRQAVMEGYYEAFVKNIGNRGSHPLLLRYKTLSALSMHTMLFLTVLSSVDLVSSGDTADTPDTADSATRGHFLQIRATAKALLSDVNVRENFSQFLYWMSSNFTKWLINEKYEYLLDEKISNDMVFFLERYTGYISSNTILTRKIREIFLFIVGYIASKPDPRDDEEIFKILSSALNPIEYIDCFEDNLEQYMKNLFAKLWLAVDYKSDIKGYLDKITSEEQAQKQFSVPEDIAIINNVKDEDKIEAVEHSASLYERLKSWLKAQEVQKVIEAQQALYESDFNEEEFCRKIEEKVEARLKKDFSYLIPVDSSHVDISRGESFIIERKEILYAPITVDMLLSGTDQRFIDGRIPNASSQLLNAIRDKLLKENVIKEIIRNSIDDQAYLDQLQLENIDFIIGSESLFGVKEFNSWQKFKKFKDEHKEHIKSLPGWCYALAIKKASPELGDRKALEMMGLKLHAEIRTPTSGEIENEIKNTSRTDDGAYKYKPYANKEMYLQFSKDELYDFLRSKDRIITVSATVTIRKNMENVGFVLA